MSEEERGKLGEKCQQDLSNCLPLERGEGAASEKDCVIALGTL